MVKTSSLSAGIRLDKKHTHTHQKTHTKKLAPHSTLCSQNVVPPRASWYTDNSRRQAWKQARAQSPPGCFSSEFLKEPYEVRDDVSGLRDAVRPVVHEDGRAKVHPGEPLRLRRRDEAVFHSPHVQAREFFLGLLLPQRVARDLSRKSVGGVWGGGGGGGSVASRWLRGNRVDVCTSRVP